jgi:molecular chaperone DnaK (HSP70)
MALLKEEGNYTHVIAIDFGTGASGYGIAPKIMDPTQKPKIEVFNPCDESDDQKTPTAILFDNDFHFLAFGNQALIKYAEILDDGDSALLFQTYKMHLLHMDKNAVSADGREMPLIVVISQTLKFIAEKALNKLGEQVGKVIPTKIKWVLTVPALWSEEHKQFMRKAALEAKIIDNINSTQLLLCLEPEGASIQCREDSEETLKAQLVKPNVVMVLDCGGGTVDITVHRLLCSEKEKFLCEELLPSSGGCEWGSKFVDQFFEKFLQEFFEAELFATYKKNAMARLDILKHFEMMKRKFCPGVEERTRLQLSYLGEDLTSQKLAELIAKYNKAHP